MKPRTRPRIVSERLMESSTSWQMRICWNGRLPELSWLQSMIAAGFSKLDAVYFSARRSRYS